jgi:hypothetical protein
LVERVEGFASKHEWQRGFEEINEFERMMVSDGIRIAKIFLHITPAEQVRRFKDRLTNPLKRWKLSYEDFRNRSRWADYEGAIEDMMEKTSHAWAPWYLIPANDKPYGRLATFTTLLALSGRTNRSISKWLERAGPLNGKNSKNVVARDERGRWLKGFSGGPGRPLGSRNKLSEDFLRD